MDGDRPSEFASARPDRARAGPWISVIGIGDDGVAGLSRGARELLDEAEAVFGGRRHLSTLPRPERGRAWRSPIAASLDDIAAAPGPVAVLASGDPSWFGVARLILDRFGPETVVILPSPSAFSLAAARLGWTLEEIVCLSACGRPLEAVWPELAPGARLIVLSAGAQTPADLAAGLCDRGFGASRLHVMGHLGGAAETVVAAVADERPAGPFPALNLVAVECRLDAGARWYPRVPGLPDEAFQTDGTMTKRASRAIALSSLAPAAGELLWDIGAGSGSVAIEWLRAARGCGAVALEPRADRRATIAANARRLLVSGLDIREGEAPGVLDGLPRPDAVFVGGGMSEAVAAVVMDVLPPGGRLVVHGVTVETQGLLGQLHAAHGGELMRIAIETAEPVGRYRGWRAAMPVLHWRWVKPAGAVPRYVLGLGACSATGADEAETLVARVLAEAGIAAADLGALATLDRRAGHPALRALAEKLAVPIHALAAPVLAAQDARLATPSNAVAGRTGLRGVAEAAALALAGEGARLLVPKRVGDGVTAALAVAPGEAAR